LRDELAGVDHDIEVDAGVDAQALHHVQHVLGGDVAGRALGVRAAAQSRYRRVVNRDAQLQAGVDVGQRLAVGIVEVARQAVDAELANGAFHHRLRLARRGHADGVGDVDFVAAQVAHASHHVGHRIERHFALVGAAKGAADAAAQALAAVLGGFRHAFKPGDRFGDRAVDVLLRERFRGRTEDHHFIGLRRQRRFKALHVGRQRRVDHARLARNPSHHLLAGGHLRHPFGRDEGRRFDIPEAGAGQAVHQLDLDLGWHAFFFILQAVARTDFDDLDLFR
jgi:hypothetical protein